jgi:hypothetical protein
MATVNGVVGVAAVVLLLLPAPGPAQDLKEDVLWATIEKSTNPDDFRGYLDTYPNGTYAPLAKRRLASILEAKRATLAGTDWEGREWFTTGAWTNMKAASPDDPKARYSAISFSFQENGTCLASGLVPCTWNKTGNSVTITVAKNKTKDVCSGTLYLTLDPQGDEMSGEHSNGNDCFGSSFATLRRSGTGARPAPSITALFTAEPQDRTALQLGNIVLATLSQRTAANTATTGGYAVNDTLLAHPSSTNAFTSGNELAIFAFVYGAARSDGRPNIQVDYSWYVRTPEGERFWNHTRPLIIQEPNTTDPNCCLFAGNAVPLSAFGEGQYRVEIKVTDRITGTTAVKSASLSIGTH